MYNLLVIYGHGAEWEISPYYLRNPTRFLEFTDSRFSNELHDLTDPTVVEKICNIKTLFMYENKQSLPGWIGRLTKIIPDSSGIKIWFEIDRSRPIPWEALNNHMNALDIHIKSESERTHWAIKDADLETIISKVIPTPVRAFVSYKWESEEHRAWVRKLAEGLRARGVNAILDQWEVRLGESFTDYMQTHIAKADVILFVITSASVAAAEAPSGKGGSLKFEVQMMNARRIAEGTRIIGIYRSGGRPPHYLRDHRYADFRDDQRFELALDDLVKDLLGETGPPPLYSRQTASPADGAAQAQRSSTVSEPSAALSKFLSEQSEPHHVTLYGEPWGNREFVQPAFLIDVDSEIFKIKLPERDGKFEVNLPIDAIESTWKESNGHRAIKIKGRIELIVQSDKRYKPIYLP